MFNSREYEWSDVNVVAAGRPVTGIRGVKYSSKQEKEVLHAKGNKTYDGELTVTQSEYEALRAAGGGDILDISIDIVVAYGNPSKGDVITTDLLMGVEFTEDNTEWKQGDKFQEKSLPFIFLDKKSV